MIINKTTSMPFAQKGELVKRHGASEFAAWQEDVPMVLKVKARRIPQWGMNGSSAGEVPQSPVHTDSPETLVELIPYGCSRLRIAEFPTVQLCEAKSAAALFSAALVSAPAWIQLDSTIES